MTTDLRDQLYEFRNTFINQMELIIYVANEHWFPLNL